MTQATQREFDIQTKTNVARRYADLSFQVRLRNGGFVDVIADAATVGPAGELIFNGSRVHGETRTLSPTLCSVFAPGTWVEFHSVNAFDLCPLLITNDDRLWAEAK